MKEALLQITNKLELFNSVSNYNQHNLQIVSENLNLKKKICAPNNHQWCSECHDLFACILWEPFLLSRKINATIIHDIYGNNR
jgi:hypothetical protein